MSKNTLLIVESPAKAKKIQEFLGKDYTVLASYGHIADLAKGGKFGIGVDINNNFKPKYVLMPDKVKVLGDILDAAKKADLVLLGGDPDREGTAICWHIQERLNGISAPMLRAEIKEITKKAVLKAINEAKPIDMQIVHAQEARRILDRLVGFMASPFLMNFMGSNLSAGRVQSVVTRMVIDREKEIESFVPEDYWTIQTKLSDGTDPFIAKYTGKISDKETADKVKKILNVDDYVISEVISQEEKKYPQSPLITSTLQRIMSKEFSFGAERTMKAAQELFTNGFITYHRTDSSRTEPEALDNVRNWLQSNNYAIPAKPYIYKNKNAAQDAHESIRPTDLSVDPNNNFALTDPDEKLVYKTIWRYFVASQMQPAIYDTLNVSAHPENDTTYKVKASGKALKSKGYLEILGTSSDPNTGIDIPNLVKGQKVKLVKNGLKMEKKQTQPPGRYSEDKLIKELEIKEIGRPATYAELLSKISSRNYVEKKGNVYHATKLGRQITEELEKFFSFMDYNYTSKLEAQLDQIEEGKLKHIEMLQTFYQLFKNELNKAYLQNGGSLCDKCKSPLSSRINKDGNKFLGCSTYPKCRFVKNIS